MKQRKTLLEWLKCLPEAAIMNLTGYDQNDSYTFATNLKTFGLATFDILPADKQHYILMQYVDIFKYPKAY